MKNKYAGKCKCCGGQVAAQEGELNMDDGRWVVTHSKCPKSAKSAKATKAAKATTPFTAKTPGGRVPPPTFAMDEASIPF